MDSSDHLDSGLSLAASTSLPSSPRSGVVGLALVDKATALPAKVARPHPLLLLGSLAPSTFSSNLKEKKMKIKKGKIIYNYTLNQLHQR